MNASPQQTAFLAALSEVRVFFIREKILGIPWMLFLGTLGFAAYAIIAAGVPAAIIFAISMLSALAIMHRNDDQALLIAVQNLANPKRWEAGYGNATRWTIKSLLAAIPLWAITHPEVAAQAPDIFTGSNTGNTNADGAFNAFINILNQWGAFITGPVGLIFIFVGFLFAAVAWIWSPRSGEIVGFFLRVLAAGFVIINLGGFIAWFANP